MEKTLQQRAQLQNRDFGASSVSAVSATLPSNFDVLREVVRAVVREELHKLQLTQGPSRDADTRGRLAIAERSWHGVVLVWWAENSAEDDGVHRERQRAVGLRA
ncbi:hypothetical protein MTO96_018066 [Rhipicephalus appendiculatus]